MRTYRAEERRYREVRRMLRDPSPDVMGARADLSYASLGEDGLIFPR